MKRCTTCGLERPLSEYSRARADKPYLKRSCIPCEVSKKHARYVQNRGDHLEACKRYVESHRDAVRAMHQKANQRRSQDPEWLERQRAKSREYGRTHRADRVRREHVRLDRIANASIRDFTTEQWWLLKTAYGGCCAYCGIFDPDRLQTEHVIPLSRGGNHTASNIVPACGKCNLRKGQRVEMPFQVIPSFVSLFLA